MTEALYLDDPSVGEFEATVRRIHPDRVVLDRTHFYPEGGGQPADTGWLAVDDDTWTVTDVRKDDTIYHVVDAEPPPEGTPVVGRLDWERRSAHMRYHTAQHLLSAHLLSAYDAATRGNQLYADRARIDVEYPRFTDDDLAAIEDRTNGLVEEAREVTWYTVERERAEETLDPERTRIELLPDSVTDVRIVEIEGVDRTACAGTHVSNTADVGRVRVTGRRTQGSDTERLTFELEG